MIFLQLIQLTAVELGLDATSNRAQAFGASKTLKQYLIGKLHCSLVMSNDTGTPQVHHHIGSYCDRLYTIDHPSICETDSLHNEYA